MRIMPQRPVLHLAIVAIVATLATLPLARAETVLRWASVGGALTFDPHGQRHTPTEAIQNQVYEALVRLKNSLVLEPGLAIAWDLIDPVTWQFTLREGVRFHDGTPLTADDVVFSVGRARAEKSEVADLFKKITGALAVDNRTVQVKTSSPDLLLPVSLSSLMIMPRGWAERHDAVEPSRPKDDLQGWTAIHANGTGPFRLEAFEPAGRIVMVRNPDWWGGEVAIDRIVHDTIPDPDERLAALLSGELDLLIDPPFAALDQIRATPGLKLEQTTEFRAIFLALDQASTELRSSNLKGRNPFKDRSVRRAMYQAIDIERIRDEIMNGLALPAGMIIEPGVNGYSPELDRRLPFDPEGAKRLLADAGYPDGFSIQLDCPNNRYINDEAICRQVATQLGAVGIAVTVNAQPLADHLTRIWNHETDFYMLGWGGGMPAFDSAQILRDWFHSVPGNRYNATGYGNPQLDALIAAIDAEMVTYARDALIEEAWQIALDDIPLLPLHHQVIVWAMRDDLQLPIDPRAIPWFKNARFGAPAQE